MPEATVHEHGEALLAENEIRLAGQWLLATPSGDVVCAKNSREFEFCVLVPVRANCRHHKRAFLPAEHIRHAAQCRQSAGAGQ